MKKDFNEGAKNMKDIILGLKVLLFFMESFSNMFFGVF